MRDDSGCVSMLGRAAHAASGADDEPKQSAAGWVVGALNGIDCRLFDVSVALSFGNQQSLRVAVGLAHALTVTGGASGQPELELNIELLRKEMQLERVRVELSHSGAKAVVPLCTVTCLQHCLLAGCALVEPLLQLEKCTLQAVLPLFSDQAVHAPVRLAVESSPVVMSWCALQLREAGGLFMPASNATGGTDAERLEEARRVQQRQADVIAHLLTVNDELESRVEDLEASNIALSSALERHVAVVATLAAENACMLERG